MTNADTAYESTLEEYNQKYNKVPAAVYCTNGGKLQGTVRFLPDKWIEVKKDAQTTALVNLSYVVSIAFDTSNCQCRR